MRPHFVGTIWSSQPCRFPRSQDLPPGPESESRILLADEATAADVDFVVAARNALPAILEELIALRALSRVVDAQPAWVRDSIADALVGEGGGGSILGSDPERGSGAGGGV
jgi:hypothetical protein